MTLPLAMGWGETLVCGTICGLGLLVGLSYLLTGWIEGRRQGVWQLESGEAFGKRMRRRRLGAGLLITISVGFFVGVVMLQPAQWPAGYLMYWLVVLAMLAWLLGLGVADLLQTRRMLSRSSRNRNDRDV